MKKMNVDSKSNNVFPYDCVDKDKDGFEAGHNMFENCVSLVGGNRLYFKDLIIYLTF